MTIVLIAGGTGLVGSHLSKMLTRRSYTVWHLSRTANPDAEYPTFLWDVEKGTIDDAAFRQVDYVINLTGAGIADQRWTEKRKQEIVDSRVNSTHLLLETFKRLGKYPKCYLSSAAIGYYGNSGEATVAETTGPGRGFLTDSCIDWENAIAQVKSKGIRTVIYRIGLVLSVRGGALEKMLIPLKFGVSPYFGNGKQWYSWIHIDDLCALFIHGMENKHMSGTYNATAPNPERNKNFAKKLGEVFAKRAFSFPIPSFILRLIFGEMADTILFSTRVSSQLIVKSGFFFLFPDLPRALEDLKRKNI